MSQRFAVPIPRPADSADNNDALDDVVVVSAGAGAAPLLSGFPDAGFPDGCGWGGFEVVATVPRGTVLVGPGTKLEVEV